MPENSLTTSKIGREEIKKGMRLRNIRYAPHFQDKWKGSNLSLP